MAWCPRCLLPGRVANEGADWVLHLLGLGGAAGPAAFTEHAGAGGPAACPQPREQSGEHLLLWCPA
eukprot:8828552-Alexandrium_andersonii.AAC.1